MWWIFVKVLTWITVWLACMNWQLNKSQSNFKNYATIKSDVERLQLLVMAVNIWLVWVELFILSASDTDSFFEDNTLLLKNYKDIRIIGDKHVNIWWFFFFFFFLDNIYLTILTT